MKRSFKEETFQRRIIILHPNEPSNFSSLQLLFFKTSRLSLLHIFTNKFEWLGPSCFNIIFETNVHSYWILTFSENTHTNIYYNVNIWISIVIIGYKLITFWTVKKVKLQDRKNQMSITFIKIKVLTSNTSDCDIRQKLVVNISTIIENFVSMLKFRVDPWQI